MSIKIFNVVVSPCLPISPVGRLGLFPQGQEVGAYTAISDGPLLLSSSPEYTLRHKSRGGVTVRSAVLGLLECCLLYTSICM